MNTHTHTQESRREYFTALTGLRAIAAGLVCFHHFNPFSPEKFGWRIHSLIGEMHIGVTVFFVLSGFLIGHRYLGQKRLILQNYFANRFARIYPIYLLLTTLTALTLAARSINPQPFLAGEYFLNITFLRGLSERYVYTGIGQGWSLTVEEMFYASAPVAFWFTKRSWHWLWALPLCFITIGIGLVLAFRLHPFYGLFGSFSFLFYFTFFGRAIEFFVGMALAWWMRRTVLNHAPHGLTYAGLIGSLLCLGALSLLHGPQIGSFGVFQPAGVFINNVLLPLLGIAPLLWGLVKEDTWVSRFLGSGTMVLLGKSSYVFYLLHMGALQEQLRGVLGNDALTEVVLYGASVLLFLAVEEPLNHWLRKVLSKPSAPQCVPALAPAGN